MNDDEDDTLPMFPIRQAVSSADGGAASGHDGLI